MKAEEIIRTAQESYTQNRILHDRMDWFAKHWAPDDRRKAAEFHADFLLIVQGVYAAAQEPAHQMMLRLVQGMPMSFGSHTIVVDDKK